MMLALAMAPKGATAIHRIPAVEARLAHPRDQPMSSALEYTREVELEGDRPPPRTATTVAGGGCGAVTLATELGKARKLPSRRSATARQRVLR